MAMPVVYHPQYEAEWRGLPPAERAALASAAEKLRADSQLGFPHTSRVQGSTAALRELRPRRGRAPRGALFPRGGGGGGGGWGGAGGGGGARGGCRGGG